MFYNCTGYKISWIFGIINRSNNSLIDLDSVVTDPTLFKYSSKTLKIFAGGNKDNLFFNESKNNDDGWIISGIGLKPNGQESTIFNKEDWSNHLNGLENIDGHFAAVKWNEKEVAFESDQLGLRDIYISKSKDEIIFSTRVDYLVNAHQLKIDFSEFGSRWLLFNQISNNSIFHGVERIIAGKKATISLSEFTIKYYDSNWLPDEHSKNIGIEEFSAKLKPLIFINNQQTLGLSGGMDSRVILSYLLREKLEVNTFTFGDPKHPDSLIAQTLVNDNNLINKQYHTDLPTAEELIFKIRENSLKTIINNAASVIFQSLNYSSISIDHSILIDGCLGEIWRREFFYRLYYNGEKSILNRNIKKIIPNLFLPHADIFSDEINVLMLSNIENQLNYWFEILPSVEKIGVENWIDLFALKTRMPNYFSHEQTRIDENVTSLMPFAQLSLLKSLFNVPIPLRKNGKMLRALINKNYNSLEKYPLVKGSSLNPYFFNSFQSRVLSQFRKKFNRNTYQEHTRENLLNILKPYILDISASQSFKNSEMYNQKKVRNIINSYFNGNLNYGYALDWWLSFELFRQNLE